jgi:hypothetical protein
VSKWQALCPNCKLSGRLLRRCITVYRIQSKWRFFVFHPFLMVQGVLSNNNNQIQVFRSKIAASNALWEEQWHCLGWSRIMMPLRAGSICKKATSESFKPTITVPPIIVNYSEQLTWFGRNDIAGKTANILPLPWELRHKCHWLIHQQSLQCFTIMLTNARYKGVLEFILMELYLKYEGVRGFGCRDMV